MRYRDFLINRFKASWQSTLSFLKEHLRVEIATVLAGALITGYLQGESLVMMFFGSVLGGLAPLVLILCAVFVYQYAMYPVLALTAYERSSNDEQQATGKFEIVYRPGVAPFEESDRGNQQFSIGVLLKDVKMSVDDVSVKLEKLEPTSGSVPLLDFRELIYPFAERYAKELSPNRSVNLNPGQTRYFEIVFSWGSPHGPELCFFPKNYPLKSGSYLLGLRATGKNCRSEYAEFNVVTTEKGIVFDRVA